MQGKEANRILYLVGFLSWRTALRITKDCDYEIINRDMRDRLRGSLCPEAVQGDTPLLGHIRDVRPEWVSFPGQKPTDGCTFLAKNLRIGHNFDIILPGNRWFSSKLNKTYCSLVNFCCK